MEKVIYFLSCLVLSIVVYGRVWVVLDVKDSSKERSKTEEFILAWQTGTARSRKPKEIDANIADSKNVSSKEWFCKVCFSFLLILSFYIQTCINLDCCKYFGRG